MPEDTEDLIHIPRSIVRALTPFKGKTPDGSYTVINNITTPGLLFYGGQLPARPIISLKSFFWFDDSNTKRLRLFETVHSIVTEEEDPEVATIQLGMLADNDITAEAQKEKDNAT